MSTLQEMLLLIGIFISVLLVGSSVGTTVQEDLTLSVEQKRILDQFREIVRDRLPHQYMEEDLFLVRWLRAREYDLQRSEKFLMDHLNWWKNEDMDNIQNEDWADFKRDYKYSLESRTKDTKPTLYINVASWDIRRAAVTGKTERFLRYIDKVLDEARIVIKDEGEKYLNVSQGILLLNLEGFNLVQHGCVQCITIIIRIIGSYENHLPGLADRILIINTPAIAEPVIQIARTVFSPETNRILKVIGTNKNKIAAVLAEDFTLDELPPDVGGTKRYAGSDYDY